MPSRALHGRDPQQGTNGFSKTRSFIGGFTLIELMVVIGVIAIITSLALPSYRTLIEKRQVTSGAEQLGAFLSAVQIEAVKRSESITVKYDWTAADHWCVGISSGTEACDCTDNDPACTIDGQDRIFDQDNLNYPGAMSAMNGDGEFVFDPTRGLIYNCAGDDCEDPTSYDSAEMAFLSDDGTYALNVQVSPTGRVKYCSGSAGAIPVPGYDACAN